ncbi:nitrate assimilation regulatory nira, partial [Fusarium albosuccineum]
RYTAADHLSKDPETASWIVDLDLAITDSVRAQGGKLAELFEKMDLKDSSESDT